MSDAETAFEIAMNRVASGWTWDSASVEIDTEDDGVTSEGNDGIWVRAWVLIERDAYSDRPEA